VSARQIEMVDQFPVFSFAKTPQIVFGAGTVSLLGKHTSLLGRNVLLVTGGASFENTLIQSNIEKSLNEADLHFIRYVIQGEPSPEDVDSAVSVFKSKTIDVIVAVGGGSVMDAGKAISAMLKEKGSVKDFLEGVGTREPSGKKIPFIAIPTTAGTGSEATKNAVISEQGIRGFKKSLRHDNYVPDLALVDPELTIECPQEITAASGMDAFTQLMESYLSTKANALTDALACSGIGCIANSLMKAYSNGNDPDARTRLSYAALLSGITLSNAGLGVVHGFAQPLGSLFPIPHGVVCGGLMGIVNTITVNKVRKSDPQSRFLRKYARIGKKFTEAKGKKDDYYIDLLLDIINQYIEKMNIPRLSTYGVKKKDFEAIIKATGMKNHPVVLTREELYEILKNRL